MSRDATPQDVLEGRARWCVVEGDCLDALPALPDKSVDVVMTDPPYSEHVHSVGQIHKRHRGHGDGRRDSFGFAAISERLRLSVSQEIARLARRWSLVFSDFEGVHGWRSSLGALGVQPLRIGVWRKPDAMPQLTGDRPATCGEAIVIAHPRGRKRWNGGGSAAYWSHNIERTDREHTTQKPLSLMLELVELFTDPVEVVLDPFCGSGTTGVACIRLGRRFIGIEKDAKYAALARERLEAESKGLSLRDARGGQLPMFGDPR